MLWTIKATVSFTIKSNTSHCTIFGLNGSPAMFVGTLRNIYFFSEIFEISKTSSPSVPYTQQLNSGLSPLLQCPGSPQWESGDALLECRVLCHHELAH